VGYNIYLPPGYASSDKQYPVMYWLHGSGGNESSDIWVIERIKKYYEANMDAAQMIVVFVNGVGTSFYLDAPDGSLPVESIIINELIPHIDKTYRTVKTRTSRVIEGFSMGGYGALLYATKYPELFCSAVSYSGAFVGGKIRADDGSFLKWEDVSSLFLDWFEKFYHNYPVFVEQAMPYYWINNNADVIQSDVNIRLACGALDFLFDKNEKMHWYLSRLGISHEYEVVPEMDHNIGQMYEICGERGLCFHDGNVM